MRKLFLILAITGLVLGLAGGSQAAVQNFWVETVEVNQSTGEVVGVWGWIRCTEGMTGVVQGRVRDASGNIAEFEIVGDCSGVAEAWLAEPIESDTGFSCDEPLLAEGRRGTVEDGSGARFRFRPYTTCIVP